MRAVLSSHASQWNFAAGRPNAVWLADVTNLPTLYRTYHAAWRTGSGSK